MGRNKAEKMEKEKGEARDYIRYIRLLVDY